MGVLRDFIDFIKDALWITKTCLTTVWFWIPVAFGVYIPLQLWMALAIHPATLLIVPGFLAAYMILIEDRRLAAQYGLKKKDTQNAGAIAWNVRTSVDEYLQILNKRQMSLTEHPKHESPRPPEEEGE
jgi:hypothetical protein